MNRRNAAALLTALAGGSLTGLPMLLEGCRNVETPATLTFFTDEEFLLLEQIADTILPTTPSSPGAKAAGIGLFMDRFVADCLDVQDQEVLRQGLIALDQRCREEQGRDFLRLPPERQHDLLVQLDIEAEAPRPPEELPHYFPLLKGLTLLGYFTSEAGATQALRYVPVPGKYEGSIPYQDGDKAWAL